MLPESFNSILQNWSTQQLLNANFETSYRPTPIPFIPNEYTIAAQRRVKINFPGKSKIVEVKKVFLTSALQSNTKADEYRLEIFLKLLDEEFVKKVFDTESEMIQDLNPDGFFD